MATDRGIFKEEGKIMIVRYWWTEDGEAELCRVQREEVQSYICYHCDGTFSGDSYLLSPMLESDSYRLCKNCFSFAVVMDEE